jgi:hypothetical protein
MLWIEPYERPVEATSVRMLAPPSYALRNSVTNWSRDLFIFFIDVSPRFDAPTQTTHTQRKKHSHRSGPN